MIFLLPDGKIFAKKIIVDPCSLTVQHGEAGEAFSATFNISEASGPKSSPATNVTLSPLAKPLMG